MIAVLLSGAWDGVATTMAAGLAAVFIFSAVLKAMAPGSTTADFTRLGLPVPTLLARAVPLAEGATAVALVVRPQLGAALAIALLAAFTAVIAVLLRAGVRVSCGCLGARSERPLGPDTIVRNGALAVMAAVAATSPTMARPGLAALLIFVGFTLAAVLVVQLVALREITGRLWSVELAGEAGGTASSRPVLRKELS